MSKDETLERKDTTFDRENKTFECKNTVWDIRAAAAAQHTHFVFIAGVVMHYMYMCNVIVHMYLWLLTHVAGLLLLLVLLSFFVLAFCPIPEVIVVVDEFVFVVATVIINSLLICSMLHHAFIAIIG